VIDRPKHDHPAGPEKDWRAADFGEEHYATPAEVEAMTHDVTEE
jgi:hypothetical protein